METKIFYVCSYGGSGSKMLCAALRKYGKVEHIHSRNPPDKLCYIGNQHGGNTYEEWFNDIIIPEAELKKYFVLFIYRNPSFAIPSRFLYPEHLDHIQIDPSITLEDVLDTGRDLYKIREFYNNYTNQNKNRNYNIYCVKYEEIFTKQNELSSVLGIGELDVIDNSSRRESNQKLDKIYADLIDDMNNKNFITIC